MRQIWITRAGPPEVLQVREAPDPQPKAGEIRVRVEASGVNFADIMGRMGIYPDLPPVPVVPGYEVSGRVDAIGTGVEGNWVGRDVIALTRFGGYSDTICVPAKQVFTRPAGMSALEGAAIPVNYFTAWQLVVVVGGLKANETFSSIQRAAASASPRRRPPSISAPRSSARHLWQSTANYARWESITSSITGPRISRRGRAKSPTAAALNLSSMPSAVNRSRKDIAFSRPRDGSGCSAFPRWRSKERNVLAMLSMLASTPWLQFNPLSLMSANKGVFGVNLGHMWSEIDRMREWGDGLLELSAKGAIKPKVARSFRFDEAPQAHHFIQDRRNIGKVLLVP